MTPRTPHQRTGPVLSDGAVVRPELPGQGAFPFLTEQEVDDIITVLVAYFTIAQLDEIAWRLTNSELPPDNVVELRHQRRT